MRTLAWLIALSPVLAWADEELIGVWERTSYWDDMLDVYAEATIRYTFKTDNQFELYQNIVLHEDMPVHGDMAAGDGEVEAQADRDLAVDRDLVGLGSGTWWTVADSLFLDVSDVEETLNRDSLVAILTDIGKRTALQTCAMLDGWCPEDPEVYAAYEEAVVAEVIRNFRHALYFEGDSGPKHLPHRAREAVDLSRPGKTEERGQLRHGGRVGLRHPIRGPCGRPKARQDTRRDPGVRSHLRAAPLQPASRVSSDGGDLGESQGIH